MRALLERPVALRRLRRVGDADDAAEVDRGVHDAGDVRLALRGVGVEQIVPGPAAEDGVELPAQVPRVADAGAHALPHEGRHGVGGVAGEHDAAAAPRLRDQGAEGVDGVAHHLGLLGLHPRGEQLPDVRLALQVLPRLAGQAHELPAAADPAVLHAARHDGRGAPGVAVLAAGRDVEHHAWVQLHVHDQPIRLEAAVLAPDPQGLAHEAVGAVRADGVARPDGAGLVPSNSCSLILDVVAAVGEAVELPAEVQVDVRPPATSARKSASRLGWWTKLTSGPPDMDPLLQSIESSSSQSALNHW